MTNEEIERIALANGFKLKEQPDGTIALNPYVFEFARALLASEDGGPVARMYLGVAKERDALKQELLELGGSYSGCVAANDYNKAVIARLGELYDELKKENEQVKEWAKGILGYSITKIDDLIFDRKMTRSLYSNASREIERLRAEVTHWKANHENMVNRSRVLIERTDLPLERVKAFKQIGDLQKEIERLRAALDKVK